jgi:hypothetical protein
VDDGTAAGVADQDYRIADGVYSRHYCVDVVPEADAGPWSVNGFQPRQREWVYRVARSDKRWSDFRPRRGIQPESGNHDDIHAGTL